MKDGPSRKVILIIFSNDKWGLFLANGMERGCGARGQMGRTSLNSPATQYRGTKKMRECGEVAAKRKEGLFMGPLIN